MKCFHGQSPDTSVMFLLDNVSKKPAGVYKREDSKLQDAGSNDCGLVLLMHLDPQKRFATRQLICQALSDAKINDHIGSWPINHGTLKSLEPGFMLHCDVMCPAVELIQQKAHKNHWIFDGFFYASILTGITVALAAKNETITASHLEKGRRLLEKRGVKVTKESVFDIIVNFNKNHWISVRLCFQTSSVSVSCGLGWYEVYQDVVIEVTRTMRALLYIHSQHAPIWLQAMEWIPDTLIGIDSVDQLDTAVTRNRERHPAAVFCKPLPVPVSKLREKMMAGSSTLETKLTAEKKMAPVGSSTCAADVEPASPPTTSAAAAAHSSLSLVPSGVVPASQSPTSTSPSVEVTEQAFKTELASREPTEHAALETKLTAEKKMAPVGSSTLAADPASPPVVALKTELTAEEKMAPVGSGTCPPPTSAAAAAHSSLQSSVVPASQSPTSKSPSVEVTEQAFKTELASPKPTEHAALETKLTAEKKMAPVGSSTLAADPASPPQPTSSSSSSSSSSKQLDNMEASSGNEVHILCVLCVSVCVCVCMSYVFSCKCSHQCNRWKQRHALPTSVTCPVDCLKGSFLEEQPMTEIASSTQWPKASMPWGSGSNQMRSGLPSRNRGMRNQQRKLMKTSQFWDGTPQIFFRRVSQT